MPTESANVYSSTISIQELVEINPLAQNEYQTIYNLPIIQENNLVRVYSSRYSIGIFGNSADAIRDNEDDDNHNNQNSINNNDSLRMTINRSIVGRIDSFTSTASLRCVNSILDGKGMIEAIRCFLVNVENTTILGKTLSEILGLASNSIFTDTVGIKRTQQGCIRFCYIPNLSKTPRPFRCVLEYDNLNPGLDCGSHHENKPTSNLSIKNLVRKRIRPIFSSVVYGDDGYSQLYKDVHELIFKGGDNGSEMGAFNDLYNPQKLRNLSSSLDEYLKFGLEVGIFWVT